MKVYVYKKYCDRYAYGEESISVYANKADAEKALKMDVEEHYNATWDDIPDLYALDESDTLTNDYVSINNGDYTTFWIIEEKELIHESEGIK